MKKKKKIKELEKRISALEAINTMNIEEKIEKLKKEISVKTYVNSQ